MSRYLFTLALASVFTTQAQAQVVAYHHHSTAAGDLISAQAELRLAEGVAQFEESRAALTWEQLHKWRLERARAAKLKRLELKMKRIARTREANLARHARCARQVAERAAMMSIDVQNGRYLWPDAFRYPSLALLASEFEEVIMDRAIHTPSQARNHHHRLARIAVQARTRLARGPNGMTFDVRVQGMKCVELIEYLAQNDVTPDSCASSHLLSQTDPK
ncbi:hypothetical protein [Lacipirellula limnantheis]|uniref:Uncharacterized protein n=1 Tax=Lacipirellula limnantheis TaxID=2528024 RepID=A0A517TRI4_9BACT|nr:hypothetical protein [Lacipirellula limnantheis]QDT70986.1 hypothetical protein I41_01410 [Lacipirellula limnantheis]